MDLSDITGSITLRSPRPLRLDDGDGRRIAVLAGNVWITQEGDSRDIVLRAGEEFVLERPADALVSALGGSARIILQHGAHAERGRAHGLRRSVVALAPGWLRLASSRRPNARRSA